MSAERPLLIQRAAVLGAEPGLCDLRVVDGRIVQLAETLPATGADDCLDAGGGLLLPGLFDHHLHLFATAAARSSFAAGPPQVNNEQQLAAALEQRHDRSGSWLRGVGFHDSVCARLDRHWLDRICDDRPVRIQHRSGMLWVLNTRALQALSLESGAALPEGAECDTDGQLTGRFFNLDEWLSERLPRRPWPSLTELSADLARMGITGVTDTGVNNGVAVYEALCGARQRGELQQKLLLMGSEELDPLLGETGTDVGIGPLKLYLREASLPDMEEFSARMRRAHDRGRAVAVHCVTLVELHFALAALAEAGARPGDRIEHASVADDEALNRLAQLGVTVVTQPNFIAERGDQYLRDVEPQDIPLLYRGAGFLNRRVTLAAGSDAPYGQIDPWAAMRAAVQRRTASGQRLDATECLTPSQALALFGGDPLRPGGELRSLAAGQPADLCLLDMGPEQLWQQAGHNLSAERVQLTLCDGRVIYQRR